MNKSSDSFFQQSPHKVLRKAQLYSANLKFHHELPRAMSKSLYLHEQAKQSHEHIDFTIKRSSYQLELFRKKEADDQKIRNKFEKKIISSIQKVEKNQKEIIKKKIKDAERYSKHLADIYHKYTDQQKKHKADQKQQANKLRKELIQFYKSEEEKKKNEDLKQISVSTCYRNAVDRLQNIHKQNQQYSVNVELRLRINLNRNNHLDDNIRQKRKSMSAINTSKQDIFNKSMTIFKDREKHFIQTYANNEESSLSARKHINGDLSKTKKRLGDFFKTRVQKWRDVKKRVDQAKSQVPKKCLQLLDKTSKAFFRNTMTKFSKSGQKWHSIVTKNKSLIKQRDEQAKDEIMSNHLDIRLRNNSSSKIVERMQSMRLQASKLAHHYL